MNNLNQSKYPNDFDDDANLYVVHDSLRLVLSEDYNPGDDKINVEINEEIMNKFPDSGIITLTEQLSDPKERAISFYYSSKTNNTFEGLEVLPEFQDVHKKKSITFVTQSVMSQHHNSLKNAIIAIEEFIGIKGTTDTTPFGNTITGRTNFLKRLILTPKVWFTSDKNIGIVPFTVKFVDKSFRLGSGEVFYEWDFGDQDISNMSVSISNDTPVDIPVVEKVYTKPGKFNVKLKVTNEYGEDELEFEEFINARIESPEEAVLEFIPNSNQLASQGDQPPVFDRLGIKPVSKYEIPPTIRSGVNEFINIEIPEGNVSPSVTNAGEFLDEEGNIIDPIKFYTWSLGDDLNHSQTSSTRASYSIGGIYDIKLRVDTEFGSYRISTYENVIDIIERNNLWLFINDENNIKAYEFGLISETFKSATKTFNINTNNEFLNNTGEEERAKREFKNNVFFTIKGNLNSGQKGESLIFYPSGGNEGEGFANQIINTIKYEGFSDVYTDMNSNSTPINIQRPWNWCPLSNGLKTYFIFGPNINTTPNQNLSFQIKHTLDMSDNSVSSDIFNLGNYSNGAEELRSHVTSTYDVNGEPNSGRFAVYRSAWKDSTGFFLRNDRVGSFFRIKSFYKTDGIVSEPFINIVKINDITGTDKLEGQLVSLNNGLFFFNNTGNISAYNDVANVWETGQTITAFRSVQDSSVSGFDDERNTLKAASDGNRTVYLSFDYSNNAFIKYNGTDNTITSIGFRPVGEQWSLGIY